MAGKGPKKNGLSVAEVMALDLKVWSWKCNSLVDSEVEIYCDDEIFCHLYGQDFDVFLRIMRLAKIKILRRR